MSDGRALDNWLLAYAEFTQGTESPDLFHLWVGLHVLAGAAQRKIYLEKDYYQIHTNLYVILTSPRGRSRKTTALRIGKNILKGIAEYGKDVHFSTQASTVPAVVTQMKLIKEKNKEHQSLSANISELGTMLGSKSNEMTDFLTDIFDCNPDWDKQTIGRGLEKIEHPWFNLVAGTTPQWLGENLSKTAMEGGFVGRALFVYEDKRKRVARPRMTPRQRELQKLLVKDLAHISDLRGVFEYSPEGGEYFDYWYENVQDSDTDSKDIRIAGYYERKAVYVEKLAMLISLAEDDVFLIEPNHIKSALDLLNQIEPGMYKAFSAVGKNIYSADHERIKTQIINAGERGVHIGNIVQTNIHAIEMNQIKAVLYALKETGDIDSVDRTFYATAIATRIKMERGVAPKLDAGD